jgi:hypothetical protein
VGFGLERKLGKSRAWRPAYKRLDAAPRWQDCRTISATPGIPGPECIRAGLRAIVDLSRDIGPPPRSTARRVAFDGSSLPHGSLQK